MIRTAQLRFRVAEIVYNSLVMQGGRGRAAGGRSVRGGRGRRQQQTSSSETSNKNNSNKGDTNNNPGRGSGRHNNNNTGGTPNQQTNQHKPINIETTNFQSIFHNKLCRAAKYKVHAPQCSCPKVAKLRQHYESTQMKVKTSNEIRW